MRMRSLWTTGCIVLIFFSTTNCAPLAQEKLPSKEMEKFMKQFGYIDSGPNSEDSADAMYTVEGFKSAVQLMQRFGGLPETGELDEATLNLTKSPRCGVPDIVKLRQKRYIIGSNAWRKKRITYFLANWPGEMDPEVTRSKVEKALHVWSEVTPLKFHSRESMDADLIIAFGRSEHGDGYPFDGQGNILAHAFFPYEHGSYGGDIHFDDDEEWIDASTDKGRDGVDFFTVASHEIGHSLGLAHSTVPSSVMFPYYKGYDPNMRLDYDDIIAMYVMYAANNKYEDEPVNPPSSTDKPRSGDEPDEPKTDDDDTEDKNEDDYYYTVSDDTPKDDDFHHSGENDPEEPDKENESDYTGYETSDETIDVTTGIEEKSTDEYALMPHTTESSSTVTASSTTATKIPDLCSGSIDAASLLRNELFVFKGMDMWRLSDRNQILPGYPVYFHHFFRGLPWKVRSINAVYERPEDYHIIFFTGRSYWDFDGNHLTSDSPRNLTDLGLPADLDKVDAAIVWGKNKKTYFFSGDLYWRYDEKNKAMEKGYPQRIARWRGLPKLDGAFTWKDGKTYFFKDKNFWRFNNKNISVDVGFPLQTGPYWFDCLS